MGQIDAETFATGKGTKRPGRRLLSVGTDCSVGKKYTVLALERGMRERGLDADFCATGQTGVFISGRGVAIDAVVAENGWIGRKRTLFVGDAESDEMAAKAAGVHFLGVASDVGLIDVVDSVLALWERPRSSTS